MIRVLVCSLLFAMPALAEDDALAGRIWDVEAERFISFPDLVAALANADKIVIGETHGREAHQNREAFLIGALAEAGRHPALVLEMLSRDQSAIVETYRAVQPEYAMELAVVLDWANSNWPAWSFYYPVFNMGFATKAPILGGDLPDGDPGTVTQNQEVASLPYYRDSMISAHCGLIDEARALDLARTQMARDQSMAWVLEQAASLADGAVLIAGASHIQHSTGVPSLLDGTVVTLLLQETDVSLATFEANGDAATGLNLGEFDYVWFTPKDASDTFCDKIGK